MPEGSKVIAHRGYWNTDGAAQNSIASVQNAIDNKFYGSANRRYHIHSGRPPRCKPRPDNRRYQYRKLQLRRY